MLDCIVDETMRQDKQLNAVYKQLLGTVSAARQKDLREAQRAWIKFRDANCDFYYDSEGGSSAQLIASDCRMTMTADRTAELRSLYDMSR